MQRYKIICNIPYNMMKKSYHNSFCDTKAVYLRKTGIILLIFNGFLLYLCLRIQANSGKKKQRYEKDVRCL